uniref:Trafficking protein particle complex subunit n=1 Tax=Oryza meridionalis TaxID=40149 RepID=A0A0E0DFU5_9ORYZ
MASTVCFAIVSKNDIPIYEAEVGSAPKKEDLAYQHQFILHAALDVVQDLAWSTNAMFLKSVDRFNDLVVSVYIFLNPLYLPGSRITSSHFDTKVRALARSLPVNSNLININSDRCVCGVMVRTANISRQLIGGRRRSRERFWEHTSSDEPIAACQVNQEMRCYTTKHTLARLITVT